MNRSHPPAHVDRVCQGVIPGESSFPLSRSTIHESPDALRILIVEDHADCAASTAMFLRVYGHKVEIAEDGPTALEVAKMGKPDVVLLDIGLPGMNGYEVARHLSGSCTEMKPLIIAITGCTNHSEAPDSSETGIHFHMIKPVDPVMLQTLLTRYQKLIRN